MTALVVLVAPVHGADETAVPARAEYFSIQIVNPDAKTSVRVVLDGKVVFDTVPMRSSSHNGPTVPAVIGPFAFFRDNKHQLIAEVPATHTRAQLEWTPRLNRSPWVVIHFYPGRSDEGIPPFLMFALQAQAHKLR